MKNKEVLVTGADGFIGSHLVDLLCNKGYQVTALVQYNSFQNWGWLEKSSYLKQIKVVLGDVRDPVFCNQLVKNKDIIFHLAALIAIPYSYQAPYSYIETNVNGTANICQAALNNNTQRVIITSTSEVYGTAQYVPIDEKHPLQPQSPYSASKIAADAIAMSYFYSFELPVIIARPFNTYGPRQSARAVIPTVITQIAKGSTTIKLGDITPTRDFNYITDTCRGLLMLAECNEAVGQTINIGSNQEISIGDIFHMIKRIMRKEELELICDQPRVRPKTSEVFRLWCDNTKLQKLTGYKPAVSLEEGITKTINWFMDSACLAQYKADLYNV